MKDLIFISGEFFDFEIPKEKKFLFKYFKADLEHSFLKYYFCFGDFENFTDHTGCYCQVRWLRLLKKRLDKLLAQHQNAKAEYNFELLRVIEDGNYKVKN